MNKFCNQKFKIHSKIYFELNMCVVIFTSNLLWVLNEIITINDEFSNMFMLLIYWSHIWNEIITINDEFSNIFMLLIYWSHIWRVFFELKRLFYEVKHSKVHFSLSLVITCTCPYEIKYVYLQKKIGKEIKSIHTYVRKEIGLSMYITSSIRYMYNRCLLFNTC